MILVIESRKRLNLSQNRDFIFESQTLNSLSVYAHVINYTIFKVFVRNNFNRPVILSKNQKLGKVTNYDDIECYFIAPKNRSLTVKSLKRQSN